MIPGLIDTCLIIDLLQGRPEARGWYETLRHGFMVSRMTWFELFEGVFQQRLTSDDHRAAQRTLLRYLTPLTLIEISNPVSQHAGDLYLRRKPAYLTLSPADCLIAATALHQQVPLYSRNVKHMAPLLGEALIVPYML